MFKNYYLIKNNYFIVDNKFNDDFHIAIYYLNPNKCKIIIRRVDDSIGWGQDLNIKIMDIDNVKYDRISLGSSIDNLKIIEIYTNVLLHKLDGNGNINIIPKTIIQCSDESMNKSIFHYNAILSFIELNPDYEYKFFNDIDCRIFIKENYLNDDINILKAFDLIYDGALKAKLFKYAYLYLNGGCYFHCKMILQTSLNNIINQFDKLIVYNDAVLCIEKNNIILKDLLLKFADEIFNKTHEKNIVNLIVSDNMVNLHNKNNGIYFLDKLLLKTNYKNYISNSTTNSNKYYYKNINYETDEGNEANEFIFYLHPTDNLNQNFKITYLFENLFSIKRIDKNTGWNNMIKLKVINEKTNHIFHVDIGNSELNEKQIIL